MEPKVIHNEPAYRYEIWADNALVGHADYIQKPGERHFVHTEVNPDQQGKGYAATLMREAFLELQKTTSDKVVPICSYVVAYVKSHPETHILLRDPVD